MHFEEVHPPMMRSQDVKQIRTNWMKTTWDCWISGRPNEYQCTQMAIWWWWLGKLFSVKNHFGSHTGVSFYFGFWQLYSFFGIIPLPIKLCIAFAKASPLKSKTCSVHSLGKLITMVWTTSINMQTLNLAQLICPEKVHQDS